MCVCVCVYKVHACVCVCVCSLVAGDVEGNFKQLFTRVQTIVKKNGPFEVSVVLDHAACCSGTAQSLPPLVLSLSSLPTPSSCCCVWVRSSLVRQSASSNGRRLLRACSSSSKVGGA